MVSKTEHLTIMFTDIKGFTSKTSMSSRDQLDELLKIHDELIIPIFEKFNGKVIKTIGDAFMVTFYSPTNAVLCGIKIQEKLSEYNEKLPKNERLEVRVAINSGEVTIKNNDIFGEAVNIASRLEGIADAGDIYFTESVYLSMNKAEIPAAEIGYRYFKGIPDKIRVYKVLREKGKNKWSLFKKDKPIKRKIKHKKNIRKKIVFLAIFIFALLILTIIISNQKNEEKKLETAIQNSREIEKNLEQALIEKDEFQVEKDLNELRQISAQANYPSEIENMIRNYEIKYQNLIQLKEEKQEELKFIKNQLEESFNNNNEEQILENIEKLKQLSSEIGKPQWLEDQINNYELRYQNYVKTKSEIMSQIENLKQDTENAFANQDKFRIEKNINELKQLSEKLNNPLEIENIINNYENRYNELILKEQIIQELSYEKKIQVE